MADRWAVTSGNWSDTATWNGGTLPSNGDDVYADGYSITIDQDITVGSIRTETRSGGSAGGGFSLNAARILICNIYSGTTKCVETNDYDLNVIGDIYGGISNNTNAIAINQIGTGNLSVIGNVYGRSGVNSWGIFKNGGSLTITGDVFGGSTNNGFAVELRGSVTANVTGDITGPTVGNGNGLRIAMSGGSVSITGNILASTGTGAAILQSSVQPLIIDGNVFASSSMRAIDYSVSGGFLTVNGNIICGETGIPAIYSLSSILIPESTEVFHTFRTNSLGAVGAERSLYTGGINLGQPIEANVRNGISYGVSSEYTGALIVPDPQYVSAGVPTDNTVGTLLHLDAEGIRTAVGLASANLDTQLGTIDTVVDNIEVDTQNIQSRLPAALVGGRIDASVGAMAANTLTASALATDAAAEIADAVWDEPYSQHTSSGSFGKLMDIIRKANLTIDGEITSAITPTTLTFSSNISSVTSSYAHAVLLFVTGALEGENSPIISYNNTNGVFVLEEPLTAAPSVGDEFVVIAGSHVHSIADIQQGLATSAEAAAIQAVVDAIELDTQNIQSRLPNALVGGRIDAYASNLEDIATNSQTPILERSVSDDQSINFTWPVSGATITANVSIDNGTLTPVAGTISFLRTESTGKNVYSLSYDAADRPSSEGHARYILTDGTYTRSFSVRISDTANQVFSSGDVDGYSLEEALKIMLAALAGKVTGGGTTSIVFRAADDSKDRITATVTSAGNRTSITLDADG